MPSMSHITFPNSSPSFHDLPLRRFDANESVAIAEAGVFEDRTRVKLIPRPRSSKDALPRPVDVALLTSPRFVVTVREIFA